MSDTITSNQQASPFLLTRYDLRYYLTALLIESGEPTTVAELREWLHAEGFGVTGRASRTIPDILRSEINKRRVVRVGRGVYVAAVIPRSTYYRILKRARELRAQRDHHQSTLWF